MSVPSPPSVMARGSSGGELHAIFHKTNKSCDDSVPSSSTSFASCSLYSATRASRSLSCQSTLAVISFNLRARISSSVSAGGFLSALPLLLPMPPPLLPPPPPPLPPPPPPPLLLPPPLPPLPPWWPLPLLAGRPVARAIAAANEAGSGGAGPSRRCCGARLAQRDCFRFRGDCDRDLDLERCRRRVLRSGDRDRDRLLLPLPPPPPPRAGERDRDLEREARRRRPPRGGDRDLDLDIPLRRARGDRERERDLDRDRERRRPRGGDLDRDGHRPCAAATAEDGIAFACLGSAGGGIGRPLPPAPAPAPGTRDPAPAIAAGCSRRSGTAFHDFSPSWQWTPIIFSSSLNLSAES